MRDVLNTDRRLSIRAITEEVGIDKMTVYDIVKNDLGMGKICAKLVPKHLTDEQKERRVAVASETLDRLLTEPDIFDSPDTAPPDFFLFPKIKKVLKGTRFGTLEAVTRYNGGSRRLTGCRLPGGVRALENPIPKGYRLQWGLLQRFLE